jgi:hypothetical protein
MWFFLYKFPIGVMEIQSVTVNLLKLHAITGEYVLHIPCKFNHFLKTEIQLHHSVI